jgi:hypothetical protein
VEIPLSPIVGPLELNEVTTNPIAFIKIGLREFDELTIHLANFNE